MENFLLLDEKKICFLFHQNNLTTHEYGNGIYTRYIVDDIDRIIRLSAICNKRGVSRATSLRVLCPADKYIPFTR